MSSINTLIVRAEELGSYAADRLHGLRAGIIVIPESNGHHPGNDTGELVLEAYREHGLEEIRSVVTGYQRGYNQRASEMGDMVLHWVQVKNGVGWALPSATDDEKEAILAALENYSQEAPQTS